MARIVISYRRSDSAAITGRIFDKLSGHFGRDSVFMDVDNIPFGTDFRDHIRQVLDTCDMLIAVIGPEWTGPGADGAHRIKNASDFVRMEVETALQRGIPVVPLLVGATPMPDPANLPETLAGLVFRNAAEVDPGRDFHPHMDRLIAAMELLLPPEAGGGRRFATKREHVAQSGALDAALERARAVNHLWVPVALAIVTAALSYAFLPPWSQVGANGATGRWNLLSVGLMFGVLLVVCEYLWGRRRWYTLVLVLPFTVAAWNFAYQWSYVTVLSAAPDSRGVAALTGGFISGAIGAALTGVSLSTLRSWKRMATVTLIGAVAGLALCVDIQYTVPLLYFVWQIGFAAYFGWCIHLDRKASVSMIAKGDALQATDAVAAVVVEPVRVD